MKLLKILLASFLLLTQLNAETISATTDVTTLQEGHRHFVAITGFNGHTVNLQFKDGNGWHNYDGGTHLVNFTDTLVLIGDSLRIKITGGTGDLEYRIRRLADNAAGSILGVGDANQSSYYTNVARGLIPGHSLVHKFGAGSVGTTIAPISLGVNDYPTPIAPVALEIVSSDANDTALGTGAQTITVVGSDVDFNEVAVTYSMNGLTPVPIGNWCRIYRVFVATSGTYATSTAGSHKGTLTVRVAGAGASWVSLPIVPFPVGQSQIGAYTIPAGKTGWLLSKSISVDSVRVADVYFFQRPAADDDSDPFTGVMRLVERELGVTGTLTIVFETPKGPFVGPCDIGFMARVATSTADVSVEFELIVIDN
jgi:hypothetical protein